MELQDQILRSTSKAPFVKNKTLAKTLVSVSYDNTLEKFALDSSNFAFLFYYKYISHVVVQESNIVKYTLYGISAITQGVIQHNSKLVVKRLTHHHKMAGKTQYKGLVQLRCSTKVQLRSNFCRASHIPPPQLKNSPRKGSLLGPHKLSTVKD